MIFITAKHGNEEEFFQNLHSFQQKYLHGDTTFFRDYVTKSLTLHAIQGDNPAIFDEALRLSFLTVDQLIELDEDDSDSDCDALSDIEEQEEYRAAGWRHFSSRHRHPAGHDEELDSVSIAEHLVRHAQHVGEAFPRSYRAGTKLLYEAVKYSSTNIVEHLIGYYGVTDDVPDGFQTILHLAVAGRHENLIYILIERAGSRVNSFNHRKMTPLHLALRQGHYRIAKMLLLHGADCNVLDGRGQSALELAQLKDALEVLLTIQSIQENRSK